MAVLQQLVQAFQVFHVAGKVVEEHDVEENAHDLCQRRFLLIGNLDLMFLIFTADPDCENLPGSQPYDRTERLLKAYAPVSEVSRAFGCFEPYWLKN